MRQRPEAETQTTEGNGAVSPSPDNTGVAEARETEPTRSAPEPGKISRVEGWKRENIYGEDWGRFLPHAVRFAEAQIRRRYWRGQKEGVMPEGYDANSVASEVIAGMLVGKCKLALGWTVERFIREMERRIENEIRNLARLAEVGDTRNEWDILPPDESDEPQSVFDGMLGTIPDPRKEAERNEEEAWREEVRADLNEYLKDDREAKDVFNCLCDGVVKRREIAERLGIAVEAVTAARKRLERKVEAYKSERFLKGLGE